MLSEDVKQIGKEEIITMLTLEKELNSDGLT